MLVSGVPPIRASKLKYYADRNFLARRLPAPELAAGALCRCAAAARRRLVGPDARAPHARLDKAWSELVAVEPARTTRARPRTREIARRRSEPRTERPAERPAAVRRRAGRSRAPDDDDDPRCGRTTIDKVHPVARAEALDDRRSATPSICRVPLRRTVRPGRQAAQRRQVGAGRGGARREPRAASSIRRHRGRRCCAGSTSCTRRWRDIGARRGHRHRDAVAVRALLPDHHAAAAAERAGAGARCSAGSASRCSSPRSAAASPPITGSSPRCWRRIAAHKPDLFATRPTMRRSKPPARPAPTAAQANGRAARPREERPWLISSPSPPPRRRRDAAGRCCAPPSGRPSPRRSPIRPSSR